MSKKELLFTKIFKLSRNLLGILITIYVISLIWKWNWIVAILLSIPICIIIMNIIAYVTLPIYYLTPEYKLLKESKKNQTKNDICVEQEKAKKMILNNKSEEFSPKEFSDDNFTNAINCTNNLIENNQEYANYYCKSYHTLKFSKTSLELAFNYLLDSIIFDKNSPIYNNDEFASQLRGTHATMILTYVNVALDEIPTDKIKQVKFNSERKINVGENQMEITKLIEWRNDEQWAYFLNIFGIDSELGKICLTKIKNNDLPSRV